MTSSSSSTGAFFPAETPCPCGSSSVYQECCGALHTGAVLPSTPEALMRSRYSAFVTGHIDYLKETLRPDCRHDFDHDQTRQWAESSHWEGLSVLSLTYDPPSADADTADEGYVEFIARFKTEAGEACLHHETGHFAKHEGCWYYVDGISGPRPIRTTHKAGRNDPCPCGSGKKFKKCCAVLA